MAAATARGERRRAGRELSTAGRASSAKASGDAAHVQANAASEQRAARPRGLGIAFYSAEKAGRCKQPATIYTGSGTAGVSAASVLGAVVAFDPANRMILSAARPRMMNHVGSISNQRTANLGDIARAWWLFWKSSPQVTKSKGRVFLDLSPCGVAKLR